MNNETDDRHTNSTVSWSSECRSTETKKGNLLPAANNHANGSPLFEKEWVEKYKVLAECLGGK